MEGVMSFTIEVDIEIEQEDTIDDVVDLTSEDEEEEPINIQFKPDYVLAKRGDDLIFNCTQCNTKFLFAIPFLQHLIQHELELRKEAKITPTYLCEICGQNFVSLENFLGHQKGHSEKFECNEYARSDSRVGLEYHNSCLVDFTGVNYNEETTPARLQCKTCRQTFCGKQELEHHINSKDCTQVECNICKRKFSNKRLMHWHKKTLHGIFFECNKCKTKFANRKNLKNHEKRACKFYVAGGYYFCDVCSMRAASEKKMRRHIRNIHHPLHSIQTTNSEDK